MRLTLSILGTEVFAICTDSPSPEPECGDVTTYPLGFTASHGDQRRAEHHVPEG